MVSVIIPTYKSSGVVGKAIKSVLNQTYHDIEIIVVDDNSPESLEREETEKVMFPFLADTRVVYLKHEKNKNGSAARNTGIRYAHGEFIAFLDDDDCFLPSKIEKQVQFLSTHPTFDAVYCYAQMNGVEIAVEPYEGDATRELLLMKTRMFTTCLMFRAEPLRQIHGFDEAFRRHQDYELLLRFFNANYKIGCVKEPLVERGTGGNNNIPSSKSLQSVKVFFLNTFSDCINNIDEVEPGFRKKVYALHYGSLLVPYLQEHEFTKALQLTKKYFWYSPSYFTRGLRRKVIIFIGKRLPFASCQNGETISWFKKR
ncbi:MAG: glycosyltransferase family 2 protein [Bacteroidaceae bacterium]|nr:glycosyltransferase family 2 protein [Bacteroidaceae bacterium]